MGLPRDKSTNTAAEGPTQFCLGEKILMAGQPTPPNVPPSDDNKANDYWAVLSDEQMSINEQWITIFPTK